MPWGISTPPFNRQRLVQRGSTLWAVSPRLPRPRLPSHGSPPGSLGRPPSGSARPSDLLSGPRTPPPNPENPTSPTRKTCPLFVFGGWGRGGLGGGGGGWGGWVGVGGAEAEAGTQIRRFWSMSLFIRASCWVLIFDPLPFGRTTLFWRVSGFREQAPTIWLVHFVEKPFAIRVLQCYVGWMNKNPCSKGFPHVLPNPELHGYEIWVACIGHVHRRVQMKSKPLP